MDNQRLIATIWESYRDTVIPKDAGETQLIECRRAFYAGARGLLTTILCILEPGAEASDKDLITMAAIETELKQFCEDVKAGRKSISDRK